MSDALRRGVRTFVQGFIGILAISAIPVLNGIVTAVVAGGGNDVEIDLNIWRNILLAAIAGGVIALIAWAQNALEDKEKIPTLLK
jgi:hypothetical protein